MVRLAQDESFRRTMSERARSRAGLFTWQESARSCIAAIQDCLPDRKTK